MIFVNFLIEKILIPCSYYTSFSHLAPCTPTKSNLYIGNSLVAAVSEHALYQCFSNFVRPRPGKFFFYKTRARSQQIYS